MSTPLDPHSAAIVQALALEEIYEIADALSEPTVLTDEPQTPSVLARKAKVTTQQAHRALCWMVANHYAVAVGNGAWTRYRTRRAGEVTW